MWGPNSPRWSRKKRKIAMPSRVSELRAQVPERRKRRNRPTAKEKNHKFLPKEAKRINSAPRENSRARRPCMVGEGRNEGDEKM